MNPDKRTTHTDALETLGNIIDNTAKRDAIHLAVEPCIAGERLLPGQHIGIVNGKATRKATKKLGIVDPFIDDIVMPGEMFWLIIYPRQITSLRHVWEHPDFDLQISNVELEPTVETVQISKSDIARQNIENYADRVGLDFDELMYAADNYLSKGNYLCNGSQFEGEYLPDEFWDWYEEVKGTMVPDAERGSFFTCSC